MVVTDDTTRAELAEALGHLSHAAQREMPVVGSVTLVTPWDKSHERIDAMLDDWQRAS